ncbi:MAG: DUF1295 domain-containing protein [Clostridia bacterium]
MKDKLYTKMGSLFLVVMVYAAAFLAAAALFSIFRGAGVLVATLIADVGATLMVWGAGLIFKNASLYDPYWSVVPVMVIPFWVLTKESPAGSLDLLVIIAVAVWGLRLTVNWINGWRGLRQQDWRYTMLKEKNPDIWFFTNLGGINLMPTILVFMGMVPAYYMITSNGSVNVISVLGFLICLLAAAVQYFADRQMAEFRKKNPDNEKCIRTGLWKYSRHPNYLGEVSFWWGIWLMQAGGAPGHLTAIAGPILISLLFVFISIPMMERHVMEKRPEYAEYKKDVAALIPWPRKKG